MASILYDESGATYDDAGYFYDGEPLPPIIDVTSWQFFGDGTEAGAVALNSERRNAVIPWDTNFQLRVKIQNNGASDGTVLPKLQYRYIKKGTGGTTNWEVGNPEVANNTQWNDLETTSLLLCRAGASASLTDNGATTERLTGANTFVAGKVDEADGTFNSGVVVAAGEETEFVWSLKLLEADKESDSEAIQFQIVPSTSAAYPSNSTLYDSQVRNPIINPVFYWEQDFEAGSNGAAINTTDASPNSFDAISDTGSNLTYSSTSPAHGSLSMDINKNDTDVTRVRWWDLNQANGGWIRFYVYPIANTDNTLIMAWHDGGYEGTDAMGFRIEFSTTWQVRLRDNVGILETSTGTMTANEWNRIEIYVQSETDDAAADGTLEVRVWSGTSVMDNATSPTFTIGPYTAANTDTEWEDFEIGPREGSNPVAHLRIDDIAISNTGWIGPAVTPIGKTVSAEWDIFTSIGDTSEAQWDVVKVVADELEAQWGVVAAVSDESDLQWDVLDAIFDTSEAQWDIFTPLADESEFQWGVLTPVSDQSVFQWDVRFRYVRPTITGLYRWVADSAMIVYDADDAEYAGVPLPPLGGVFRNYDPDGQVFPNDNIYSPDSAELVVTLMEDYAANATASSLSVAQMLATHLVASIKTDLTTYSYPLTLMCERWNYGAGPTWTRTEGNGSEYHMRTTLLSAYAFLKLYAYDTSTYNGKTLAAWALEMLDTGRRMQQFSFDRADGVDLPTWMLNSMSEWWNEGASNTTPHWAQHPLFLADVVWQAYTEASTQLGNTQNRRDVGTYTLNSVRDNYFIWLEGVLDSHNALMSDFNGSYVSLPYQRMYCAGDNTGVGRNNYVPAADESASADWTSDSMFWTVEGLARSSSTKALGYFNTLQAMRHGYPERYYDSYTVTGGPTTVPAAADDVTQASGLAVRTAVVLGVSPDVRWVEASQITSADDIADGSWTWTGEPVIDYVESIATAVNLWALTQFPRIVTNIIGFQWDIFVSISDDSQALWDVAAVIADESDIQWEVFIVIVDESDFQWDVVEVAGDQSEFQWDAAAAISDESDFQWDVAAAISDSNVVIWDVTELATDESDIQWDVTELAADTVEAQWDVAGAIGDVSEFVWDITEVASDASDFQWDTTALAGDQSEFQWDVGELASDQSEFQWDVTGIGSDTSEFVWDVFDAIADESNIQWDVTAIAGDESDIQWDVGAVAGDQSEFQWDVTGVASDTSEFIWDIFIVAADQSNIQWDVTELAGDSSEFQWEVFDSVSDTSGFQWDVSALISDDSEFRWDVAEIGSVGDSAQVRWDVFSTVGDEDGFEWNVASVVGDESSVLWDIVSITGDASGFVWGVAQIVSDQSEIQWDVADVVLDETDLQWDIFTVASDQVEAQWDVVEFAGDESDFQWNVAGAVSDTSEFVWDVTELASDLSDFQWDIMDAVSDESSIVWEVRANLFDDSDFQWDVFGSVSDESNIVWDVRANLFDDSDFQWDVYGDAIAQWASLLWDIYTFDGAEFSAEWDLDALVFGDVDLQWRTLRNMRFAFTSSVGRAFDSVLTMDKLGVSQSVGRAFESILTLTKEVL